MSGIIEQDNRQVMPRSLEYSTACSLGLIRVIREKEIPPTLIKNSNALEEWLDNPSIHAAVDLVGESLIVKNFESEDARKAAKYILSKSAPSNILIRQLANHFLEKPRIDWVEPIEMPDLEVSYEYIASMKRFVRMHALNPIAWSDLSLCYATLGQNHKALLAMQVALNLSNGNRFILRAASRCFIHMDEPDRAVGILNKSGLCEFDPWITSAEIAISEGFGLKSKCIGKSKYLISNDNLTQYSRSELAAGLATVEFNSGTSKKAKKLIHQSLMDPTENALAQVEWLSKQYRGSIPEEVTLGRNVPASYEAGTIYSFRYKKYEESLKAAKLWSRYLPLSSRPILYSSHIAGVQMEDDAEMVRILESSTPAQQNDPIVLNNYAFALARSGDTMKAMEKIKRASMYPLTESDRLVITATRGLVAFREGDAKKGRLQYLEAIKGFERTNNNYASSMALYFWAIEEKRIKSEYAVSIVNEAKESIDRYEVIELEDLVKKL